MYTDRCAYMSHVTRRGEQERERETERESVQIEFKTLILAGPSCKKINDSGHPVRKCTETIIFHRFLCLEMYESHYFS